MRGAVGRPRYKTALAQRTQRGHTLSLVIACSRNCRPVEVLYTRMISFLSPGKMVRMQKVYGHEISSYVHERVQGGGVQVSE